jgi:hypothetical protein
MSASPDGRLWVNTPLPFTDKSSQCDVLDGGGALIAKRSDDLMYLRRYALPAPLGRAR